MIQKLIYFVFLIFFRFFSIFWPQERLLSKRHSKMFYKHLHFSAKWNGGFNERSSWNLSRGRNKLEPFNSRNWTIKSVIVWSWVVQQWIISCLLFGEIYSGKPGGQSHFFFLFLVTFALENFFKNQYGLKYKMKEKKYILKKQ